jgi:hypothetical protein
LYEREARKQQKLPSEELLILRKIYAIDCTIISQSTITKMSAEEDMEDADKKMKAAGEKVKDSDKD